MHVLTPFFFLLLNYEIVQYPSSLLLSKANIISNISSYKASDRRPHMNQVWLITIFSNLSYFIYKSWCQLLFHELNYLNSLLIYPPTHVLRFMIMEYFDGIQFEWRENHSQWLTNNYAKCKFNFSIWYKHEQVIIVNNVRIYV